MRHTESWRKCVSRGVIFRCFNASKKDTVPRKKWMIYKAKELDPSDCLGAKAVIRLYD